MSDNNNVTDDSFEKDVLQSKKVVLVDFWAEWCGPCRQLAPVLDKVVEEIGDDLIFCKVNIDENPNVPTQYGVRSIPTLILFKDGKILSQKVGGAPKSAIVDWIRSSVSVGEQKS